MYNTSQNVLFLHDGSLLMRGAVSALESNGARLSATSVRSASDVYCRLAQRPIETDILLVGLPQNINSQFLDHVSEWSKTVPVLAIARMASHGQLASLITAGVHGYLDLDAEAETLFAALRIVTRGRFFFSGSVGDAFGVLEPDNGTPLPLPPTVQLPNGLTEREGQVLALVAGGWTHKQISSKLGLSKTTVDTYIQRIRQKLGLRNKADLTRAALQFGIGSADEPGEAARSRAVRRSEIA